MSLLASMRNVYGDCKQSEACFLAFKASTSLIANTVCISEGQAGEFPSRIGCRGRLTSFRWSSLLQIPFHTYNSSPGLDKSIRKAHSSLSQAAPNQAAQQRPMRLCRNTAGRTGAATLSSVYLAQRVCVTVYPPIQQLETAFSYLTDAL